MSWIAFRQILRPTMRIALMAMCIVALAFAPVTAQNANGAGLIIDFGDGRTTYAWVPFTEDELPVLDLIARTDLDLVTLEFGGMGAAVCQIDDTGCPAADCRARLCQATQSSPFWRFLRLQDGAWIMVGTGVSGAKARNGDIYALSWSAEPPDLPVLSSTALADRAGYQPGDAAPAMRTEGGTLGDDPIEDSWLPVGMAGGVVLLASIALVGRARLFAGRSQ